MAGAPPVDGQTAIQDQVQVAPALLLCGVFGAPDGQRGPGVVLVGVGIQGAGLCPVAVGEKVAERLHHCDFRVYHGASEGGGHEHAQIQLSWLSDKLGLG